MTDGNAQAIAQYLDKREEWDALQEVTVELEQAESDNILLIVRIEELEAKLSKSEALLARAVEAERVYCANVVKHFYDNGFFTKPDDIINRSTLAELKRED